MKALITCAVFLIAAARAEAQTPPTCLAPIPDPVPRAAVRWSWTNPTTNIDGSAIAQPVTITFYEAGVKVCQAVQANNAATGAASWQGLTTGAHTWNATAKTVDGESLPVSVQKTVAPPQPSPPSNLQVDPASRTAYQIVQAPNQVTLLAFGSVIPGTFCDMTQSVQDKDHGTLYLVPYAFVTMPDGSMNTTRKTVFAACG